MNWNVKSFSGIIIRTNQRNYQLPLGLLCSSVGRGMYQYHRGHRFNSRVGLNVFRALFSLLLKWCSLIIIIIKGLFNTCFRTRVKYNMFTLIAFSKILYIYIYIYIHTNYMKMHYYCKKAIARKKLVLLAITAKIPLIFKNRYLTHKYVIWLLKIVHNDFNLVFIFVPKILEDFFLDLFQKKKSFELLKF